MVFTYTNSLDRRYKKDKNVTSVNFSISRYRTCDHTIKFKEPISERDAIDEAEEFLSEPLTKQFLKDVIHEGNKFYYGDWNIEDGECRGELLGGAIFLEEAHLDTDGQLTLGCGS